MRDGAFDYLTKPFDLAALLATRRARRAQRARAAPADAPPPESAPTATSASSEQRARCSRSGSPSAAPPRRDVPVLITGETGVGKELVARAIHDHGARKGRPFVAVNLAALPATLVESELFGHEKGAFTGASARRDGRFEPRRAARSSSTRSAISIWRLQTKLLRVLQDGTFERVGGSDAAHVARAHHRRDLQAGAPRRTPGAPLREDLYYRLAVIEHRGPAAARAPERHPAPRRPRAAPHARERPRRAVSARRMERAARATTGPATCASSST